MIQVVVNPSTLPSIPDESCVYRVATRCRSFCSYHIRWIICSFLLIIIITASLVIIYTSKTTVLPCMTYLPNTYASAVSVECLQYIWDLSCGTRNPYQFPANYQGWWRQSPQGTAMVPCVGSLPCGVGSYSNIMTYMALCNIRS